MLRQHAAAAAIIGGSMLAGGAIGVVVFAPHLAGAQTTTTGTPATVGPSDSSPDTFGSNQDPAHEAGETPEQEAAEHSGTGRHGCHHGRAGNDDGSPDTTAPTGPAAAPQAY
jgi:hypothetical protein